ncbi:hypothetical protein M758_12G017500 [Ceratodon purpureus]|nr:hypothetical protein M758_12G017500 [Ceratodon purpureus]
MRASLRLVSLCKCGFHETTVDIDSDSVYLTRQMLHGAHMEQRRYRPSIQTPSLTVSLCLSIERSRVSARLVDLTFITTPPKV